MRCPNCNKYSALEFQDPELESFEADFDLDEDSGDLEVSVKFSARIVRNTECCGDEAKEASLEAEESFVLSQTEISDHVVKGPDGKWGWRDDEAEAENDDPEQVEEGGDRYAKSYFGASVHYTIRVGECTIHEGTLTDKVAASAMDELQ
jgi:hypothetical protein